MMLNIKTRLQIWYVKCHVRYHLLYYGRNLHIIYYLHCLVRVMYCLPQ